MTVVTGVSGSGKFILVRDIFYRSLLREYGETSERPGECSGLDRKRTRLNTSHIQKSRMPSAARNKKS